jgi:hypothetical protein
MEDLAKTYKKHFILGFREDKTTDKVIDKMRLVRTMIEIGNAAEVLSKLKGRTLVMLERREK